MKHTVSAHILYTEDAYGKDKFAIAMFPMDTVGYVTVRVQEFEIDIPDDFDPRQQKIEILQKEKQRIEAEFSKRCTQIQEQISKLQALTFEAA